MSSGWNFWRWISCPVLGPLVTPCGPCRNLLVVAPSLRCRWHGCSSSPCSSSALGRDSIGEACVKRLEHLGLEVHVAWRELPTRRGLSLVDGEGDRAITVIGERLTPSLNDDLPGEALGACDGLFVTAADAPLLKACRSAAVLAATPRVRLPVLQKAGVALDALIGSGLDPSEWVEPEQLNPAPHTLIRTEGAAGGLSLPGGRYDPAPCRGHWWRAMAAVTALRRGW